jgi:hypothetical protein
MKLTRLTNHTSPTKRHNHTSSNTLEREPRRRRQCAHVIDRAHHRKQRHRRAWTEELFRDFIRAGTSSRAPRPPIVRPAIAAVALIVLAGQAENAHSGDPKARAWRRQAHDFIRPRIGAGHMGWPPRIHSRPFLPWPCSFA